jgi:hypothetical protein
VVVCAVGKGKQAVLGRVLEDYKVLNTREAEAAAGKAGEAGAGAMNIQYARGGGLAVEVEMADPSRSGKKVHKTLVSCPAPSAPVDMGEFLDEGGLELHRGVLPVSCVRPRAGKVLWVVDEDAARMMVENCGSSK